MRALLIYASLMLGSVGLAPAQQGPAAEGPSPERKAVLAADQSFVAAYNRGDVKGLAAHFAEDAEVIEADGTRFRGRPLIEQRLAETFAASPGVRIEIVSELVQPLGADAAKAEGRTVLKPVEGASETRRHTALLVKRDGRWLIASIREETEPLVPPGERLGELDWLVGDWVDQGSDAHVRVSCRRSEDGNFLLRTFAVKRQGREVLTVQQRIGWDPLARQFRSWEFDSAGGYGEGRWSRDGDRWVIRHSGVRPEGAVGAATHIMVRERPDLVRWESLDRSVGDQAIPSEQSYVMVRVPPAPQSPNPQPARSPR
jgi:uncharacterized protein (TIGR02246 family)